MDDFHRVVSFERVRSAVFNGFPLPASRILPMLDLRLPAARESFGRIPPDPNHPQLFCFTFYCTAYSILF
jgi:hypothetical protein